jgi:hypothetical protein
MKPILTPEDKKYLKFFVKYLQSYGEKTGTFRFEDFDSNYDLEDRVANQPQLEENYYLEIPSTIVPIIDKIVNYCKNHLPYVKEDISSTELQIEIDNEGSIGAQYCWRFYTVDDQYESFDADDESLGKLFDELDEEDLSGKIFVTFDGNGDSGSIEQAEDESGNSVSIGAAMEDWCYNTLESNYGGWEINEGSTGKFIFDIESRTCELEFGWNNENTECDTIYEEKFDN